MNLRGAVSPVTASASWKPRSCHRAIAAVVQSGRDRSFTAEADSINGFARCNRTRLRRGVGEIGVAGDDALGADSVGEEHEVIVVLVAEHRGAWVRVGLQAAERGEVM